MKNDIKRRQNKILCIEMQSERERERKMPTHDYYKINFCNKIFIIFIFKVNKLKKLIPALKT